jgi:hypothetical protein
MLLLQVGLAACKFLARMLHLLWRAGQFYGDLALLNHTVTKRIQKLGNATDCQYKK